jgi:peroxiredoxin
MKNRTLSFIKVLVMFMMGISLSYDSIAQTPAPTIPEFVFYTFDKKPFTNKNLSVDKKILFIFFDITCEHCQHTIKSLNARIDECRNVSVYLLTLYEKDAVDKFLHQYGPKLMESKNVTILQDSKNQFITQFGPRKYPSVFLYSAEKKLLLYDDEDQKLVKFFKIINTGKK